MNQPITAHVTTETKDEAIERDAQNRFVATKMAHDRDQIATLVETRYRELCDLAGIAAPNETDTVTQLAQQFYDQLKIQRINILAEKTARDRFFTEYPELKVNK